MNLFSNLFDNDLGIDLGTANVRVWAKGKRTTMNMTKRILFCAAACAAVFSAAAETDDVPEAPKNDPLNAVVKLEVSTAEADVFQPWRTDKRGGDGSGVVIGDGRILTCAHCVSDATFIRVRKPNEDAIYHATVEFIGNESDLALVRVDDPAFMADVAPMEIGETPRVQ